MPEQKTIALGEAWSKVIMVGEHAVVHGKPAISIPFSLKATVSIETKAGEAWLNSSFYEGPFSQLPGRAQGLYQGALAFVRDRAPSERLLDGLIFHMESAIPLGRGLGSSAALATALIRGLADYYQWPLDAETLFRYAQMAETIAHGHPSGIDAWTVSSEGPLYFVKGKPPEPITIGKPMHLVVADTGLAGDTFEAVARVNQLIEANPVVGHRVLDEIEGLVVSARIAMEAGNITELGSLMNRNQTYLRAFGVSSEGLERLIQIALKADALGAKLTGGGLGGCMVALAESEAHAKDIAQSLIRGKAPRVWTTHGQLLTFEKEALA